MRTHWKAVLCLLGALVFLLAPAAAHADVVYFLVGVRHVYRIGPDRDAHLQEREEIEKNYADGVAQDQDTFNQHIANGADRDKESDLLNADLDALAEARDKSLGSLFEQCDSMRDEHPELRIQGDGPYQVIGVDMHTDGDTEVVDRYCVYAPWPGYICDGPYYGGWDWGVWYTPGVFIDLYWGWFDLWPGGRFWGGFCGHGGPFAWAPHGFVDRWHGGKAGGAFGRGTQSAFGGGYSHSAGAYARSSAGYSRSATSSAGGYTHGGGYSHAAAARSGGYTHSASAYSRAATPSRSSSGGYSHSSYSGASFSRSSRSYSGGSGYGGSGHSYTHSTHYGSGGGSYGHNSSSGGSRSSVSRSSGASRGGSGGGSGHGGSGSHGRGR